MTKTDSQIDTICKTLRRTYQDVKDQLTHRNPFELLIITILSAQCTDKQVNRAAKVVFKTPHSRKAVLPILPLAHLRHFSVKTQDALQWRGKPAQPVYF